MIRVLVFTVTGYLLLVLLGPLQTLLHIEMAGVDAPLIIVLYLAMAGRGGGLGGTRFSLATSGVDWTGGVVAVVLGYFSDVLGGGIKGLHCLTLAIVFLLANRAARKVYLAGTLPVVVVAFIASSVSSVIGLSIRWLGGVTPTVGSLTVLLAQAVLCALFGPPLMRLCRVIDARLARESPEHRML